MTAELISGKELSDKIREEIKEETKKLKEKDVTPHLSVILVGNDPASDSYVRAKEKACQNAGMGSEVIKLEESVSEEDLVQLSEELNEKEDVHGSLVQLPLPEHINDQVIVETIVPETDVDGRHPISVGRIDRKSVV